MSAYCELLQRQLLVGSTPWGREHEQSGVAMQAVLYCLSTVRDANVPILQQLEQLCVTMVRHHSTGAQLASCLESFAGLGYFPASWFKAGLATRLKAELPSMGAASLCSLLVALAAWQHHAQAIGPTRLQYLLHHITQGLLKPVSSQMELGKRIAAASAGHINGSMGINSSSSSSGSRSTSSLESVDSSSHSSTASHSNGSDMLVDASASSVDIALQEADASYDNGSCPASLPALEVINLSSSSQDILVSSAPVHTGPHPARSAAQRQHSASGSDGTLPAVLTLPPKVLVTLLHSMAELKVSNRRLVQAVLAQLQACHHMLTVNDLSVVVHSGVKLNQDPLELMQALAQAAARVHMGSEVPPAAGIQASASASVLVSEDVQEDSGLGGSPGTAAAVMHANLPASEGTTSSSPGPLSSQAAGIGIDPVQQATQPALSNAATDADPAARPASSNSIESNTTIHGSSSSSNTADSHILGSHVYRQGCHMTVSTATRILRSFAKLGRHPGDDVIRTVVAVIDEWCSACTEVPSDSPDISRRYGGAYNGHGDVSVPSALGGSDQHARVNHSAGACIPPVTAQSKQSYTSSRAASSEAHTWSAQDSSIDSNMSAGASVSGSEDIEEGSASWSGRPSTHMMRLPLHEVSTALYCLALLHELKHPAALKLAAWLLRLDPEGGLLSHPLFAEHSWQLAVCFLAAQADQMVDSTWAQLPRDVKQRLLQDWRRTVLMRCGRDPSHQQQQLMQCLTKLGLKAVANEATADGCVCVDILTKNAKGVKRQWTYFHRF